MNRTFMVLCLCLLCTKSVALNCDGSFKQKIVVDNEEWSWAYSTKMYSISGETLLHKEHNSFSIMARENEECLMSKTCSITDLACAITFALIEPFGKGVPLGRVQTTSYGLYFKTRDMVREVKECNRAYLEYYSKISEFWGNQLSVFGDRYKVKKVHPREIKLNKPKELRDQCFDRSANAPVLWSGVDYFPVVTFELDNK